MATISALATPVQGTPAGIMAHSQLMANLTQSPPLLPYLFLDEWEGTLTPTHARRSSPVPQQRVPGASDV